MSRFTSLLAPTASMMGGLSNLEYSPYKQPRSIGARPIYTTFDKGYISFHTSASNVGLSDRGKSRSATPRLLGSPALGASRPRISAVKTASSTIRTYEGRLAEAFDQFNHVGSRPPPLIPALAAARLLGHLPQHAAQTSRSVPDRDTVGRRGGAPENVGQARHDG
jgi:hypothetical protein